MQYEFQQEIYTDLDSLFAKGSQTYRGSLNFMNKQPQATQPSGQNSELSNNSSQMVLEMMGLGMKNSTCKSTIQIMGTGSYGSVRQIMSLDQDERNFYAEKTFNREKDFNEEFQKYQQLQDQLQRNKKMEEFKSYAMLLNKVNHQEKTIRYDLGLCTLSEFTSERAKHGIKWQKQELIYIFQRLLGFTFFMYQNGFFHSDIKCSNIIVDTMHDSEYLTQLEIKIIDFGILSKFKKDMPQFSCTPMYFYTYKRPECLIHRFQTKEERFKAEIFTLIRTFQEVCIFSVPDSNPKKKEYVKLFQFEVLQDKKDEFKKIVTPYQTYGRLIQIMNVIKNEIYNDYYTNNSDFKQLIDFMEEKLITENYDLQTLEKQFYLNQNIFNNESLSGITDESNMVSKIIQQKMQKYRENMLDSDCQCQNSQQNYLEVFFQLESYQDGILCSKIDGSEQQFDLYTQVLQFMSDPQLRMFMLLGDSGTGKSSFLVWFQNKEQNRLNVYKTDLGKYRNVQNLQEYANQLFDKHRSKKEKLVVILDGYDEMMFTNSGTYVDLTEMFKIKDYQNLKLIVTSRKCAFQISELDKINKFVTRSQIDLYFISTLNKEQIHKFVHGFIDKMRSKRYYYNMKMYKTKKQYEKRLQQQLNLHSLIPNALCLRIILEVMPVLDEEVEEEYKRQKNNFQQDQQFLRQTRFVMNDYYYSKFNIFKHFINQWIRGKIETKYDKEEIKKFVNLVQQKWQVDHQYDENNPLDYVQSVIFDEGEDIAFKLFVESKLLFEINYFVDKEASLNSTNLEDDPKKVRINCTDQNYTYEDHLLYLQSVTQCLPIRQIKLSNNTVNLEFQHKSIYEFFIARKLIQDIEHILNCDEDLLDFQLIKNSKLNQKILDIGDKEIILYIMSYMSYRISEYERQKQLLFRIINYSKDQEKGSEVSTASANIITILNAINFSFTGLDLSNSKFPGAMLQNCQMDYTNLQKADLEEVNLREANLEFANITGANLNNVEFGIFPDLVHQQGGINSINFRPGSNNLISSSSDNSVVIFYFKYLDQDNFGQREAPKSNMKCSNYLAEDIINTFELEGHTNWVTYAEESPKYKFIASCSYDNTVIVWEQKTRKKIIQFKAHDSWVNSLSFNCEEKYLATGSQDKSIKIWAIKNKYNLYKTMVGHEAPIKCVKFSPTNPNIVASCSQDRTIKIWDIQLGFAKHTLVGHQNWVSCIDFNHLGNYIISGSYDKNIILWDIENGKMIKNTEEIHDVCQINQHWITAVSFSSDSKYIVTGSYDKTVSKLDGKTLKKLQVYEGHQGSVNCVLYTPCTNFIMSGGSDKTIKIWNTHTPHQVKTLQGHKSTVNSVRLSKTGQDMISGDENGNINVWGVSSGRRINWFLDAHDSQITDLLYSQDESIIFSAGYDRKVKIWDKINGVQLKELSGHQSEINAITLDSTGQYLASSEVDFHSIIWDWQKEQVICEIKFQERIFNLEFLSDPHYIIASSLDGDTFLYNTKNGDKPVYTLSQNHQDQDENDNDSIKITACCISHDRQVFVCCNSSASKIKLYDINIKNQKEEIFKKQNIEIYNIQTAINCIVISEDKKQLIGNQGQTIRVWSTMNGLQLQIIKGHSSPITSLDFSAQNYLVSGSSDKNIIIWDQNFDFLSMQNNSNAMEEQNNSMEIEKENKRFKLFKKIGCYYNKLNLHKVNYCNLQNIDHPTYSIIKRYSEI